LISIVVLLASLLYHYHFSEPASVIDHPETHYDYVIGKFAFLGLRLSSIFAPAGIFTSATSSTPPSLDALLITYRFLIKEDLRVPCNDKSHCAKLIVILDVPEWTKSIGYNSILAINIAIKLAINLRHQIALIKYILKFLVDAGFKLALARLGV